LINFVVAVLFTVRVAFILEDFSAAFLKGQALETQQHENGDGEPLTGEE